MREFIHDFFEMDLLTNFQAAWLDIGISIVFCIAFAVVALLFSKFLRRMLKWFCRRHTKSAQAKNYDTLYTIGASLIRYLAYLFIIANALSIFSVDSSSMLAVAGVGSIAIGFGAQSLVADVIAGTSILFENQFRVGDIVEIEGKTGTVENIGLRTTQIRSYEGNIHIFPNSKIQIVTNMTKGFNRALVEVPVSYNEPIDKIFAILNDEMEKNGSPIPGTTTPPKIIGVSDIGDRRLTVRILADCEVGEKWAIEREIRLLVKRRFEREGIQAPIQYQIEATDKDNL